MLGGYMGLTHNMRKLLLSISFFAAALLLGVFSLGLYPSSSTASSVGFSGYAWSSGIGWIKFDGAAQGYGVLLDTGTREISGYAWSPNVGWLSFNRSDTSDPPFDDPGTAGDLADPNDGSGAIARLSAANEMLGWARFCSVFQSGCSGALRLPSELGGWTGWVKFKGVADDGTAYGVLKSSASDDLTGYAWGGPVTGWMSFSSKNCDPDGDGQSNGTPGCPATGDPVPLYGVMVAAALTPSATLQAVPSSGAAPLNNVQLTATLSNGPGGQYIYKFDCTNDGSYEHTSAATAATTYADPTVCNYASVQTYTAAARIEDTGGVFIASATAFINVGTPAFSVTLSPNPAVGKLALNTSTGIREFTTVLTATPTLWTAADTIDFVFDCGAGQPQGIFNDILGPGPSRTYSCTYTDVGTFNPTVTVHHDTFDLTASATASVLVLPGGIGEEPPF